MASEAHPSDNMLSHCCFNAGPLSTPLDKPSTDIAVTNCVRWGNDDGQLGLQVCTCTLLTGGTMSHTAAKHSTDNVH